MSDLAFLFPGQGSQFAGMGQRLAAHFAIARETFSEADAVLGFALSELDVYKRQVRPVLTAFKEEAALPAALVGPVLHWALARLAFS